MNGKYPVEGYTDDRTLMLDYDDVDFSDVLDEARALSGKWGSFVISHSGGGYHVVFDRKAASYAEICRELLTTRCWNQQRGELRAYMGNLTLRVSPINCPSRKRPVPNPVYCEGAFKRRVLPYLRALSNHSCAAKKLLKVNKNANV